MIRTRPKNKEIDSYSEQEEVKDTKKFIKMIDGLTNIQFAVLFSLVLDEYSDKELADILDDALTDPIKEELGDLWNFRSANGIGM